MTEKINIENTVDSFKALAAMDTETLYVFLVSFLKEIYGDNNVVTGKGEINPASKYYMGSIPSAEFIMAIGEAPVGLIAHLDTVFTYAPYEYFHDKEKNVLFSSSGMGADDRAGVLAIIRILLRGYRPSVIFTTGEESGGLGAAHLIQTFKKLPIKNLKCLIELDRAGTKDCVFYQCDNKNFTKYIESFGFETAIGTFTDISVIMPVWGIAGVNLSIGYDNEHSCGELFRITEFDNIVDKVINIIVDISSDDVKFFKFKKKKERHFWGNLANECYWCGMPLKGTKYKIKSAWDDSPCYICKECNDYFVKGDEIKI